MSDATFEDRFLVRELYGRYALAAAQKDGDAWLACWADDAIWKTTHFEAEGKLALHKSWTGIWTEFANVAAFNEVGAISVSNDTAEAVCAVYEVIELSDSGTMKMAGIYTDRLVKRNGQWQFARRDYALLSQEPPHSQ